MWNTATGWIMDILKKKCQSILNSVRRYLNRTAYHRNQRAHRNIMHLAAAREEAMESLSFQVSGIDTSIHFYTDVFKRRFTEASAGTSEYGKYVL